jgi:hypothetical protein
MMRLVQTIVHNRLEPLLLSKDRLNALSCVNATGTHKFPFFDQPDERLTEAPIESGEEDAEVVAAVRSCSAAGRARG